MPQELVLVYFKETGAPSYMHSVDAAEAVRLGDYVSSPPSGHVDDAAVSRAKQAASGIGVASHPELQTPEERQMHRDEANKHAAMVAQQVAMLQPVMFQPNVMAPGVAAMPTVHAESPLAVTRSESLSAQAQSEAEKPGPSMPTTRGAERK